ncbi:MAG: hypothetical protein CM15mP71_2030 [Candidatus Poseidoniales archaeon]|nr:MAG: hypothetical protein CM15mP71_2030 [Candidatus Poseidoniales archaeon]
MKRGFKYDLGPTFSIPPEFIEDFFPNVGLDAHEELKLREIRNNYSPFFWAKGGRASYQKHDPKGREIEKTNSEKRTPKASRKLGRKQKGLNKSENVYRSLVWATDLLSKRAMRVVGFPKTTEICCQKFKENL